MQSFGKSTFRIQYHIIFFTVERALTNVKYVLSHSAVTLIVRPPFIYTLLNRFYNVIATVGIIIYRFPKCVSSDLYASHSNTLLPNYCHSRLIYRSYSVSCYVTVLFD